MSIITLVGMMGSGKTIIGTTLAYLANNKHVDSDKIISTKMPIIDIFRCYGEQYFRQLEYQTIYNLIHQHTNCILSVGGGAFVHAKTRKLLIQHTKTVWLKVKLTTILKRIKLDQGQRPLAKLITEDFVRYRNKHYHKALIHIQCDQLTPHDIAQKIICCFN